MMIIVSVCTMYFTFFKNDTPSDNTIYKDLKSVTKELTTQKPQNDTLNLTIKQLRDMNTRLTSKVDSIKVKNEELENIKNILEKENKYLKLKLTTNNKKDKQ